MTVMRESLGIELQTRTSNGSAVSRIASWQPTAAHRLALLATALITSAVTGRVGLWLALATIILAAQLADDSRTALSMLPAAAVLTACCVLVSLLASGLLGIRPLESTTSTRVLLGCHSMALVLVMIARRKAVRRYATHHEAVACVPAAMVLGIGLWLSFQRLPRAVGGFLHGWDNGAHVLNSVAVHDAGTLSYATDAYPRGLHALVALSVGARHDPQRAPDVLAAFLRAQSLAVWSLYAVLAATVALVALRLAHQQRLPDRVAVAVGVSAGMATLTPGFFQFTMVYGFETTIALGLLLAVATLELLHVPYTARSCLVLAGVVMATSHAWTLALPVAGLPLLYVGLRQVRHLLTRARLVLAGVCTLGIASLPPFFAVTERAGVAAVAIPGAIDPLPLGWFWAGLAAAAWLGLGRRRGVHARLVSGLVASTGCLAILSARMAGASLNDYYPRKLLWHMALLSLPILAAGLGTLYVQYVRRTANLPVLRLSGPPFAVLGLTVLAVFAFPGPYMWVTGGWNVPSDPLPVVLKAPSVAAACGLDSGYARRVSVRFFRFYGPDPALPPEGALPVCVDPPTLP